MKKQLDLGPTWTYGTDEMTAWRFCPVCGERLLTRDEYPYGIGEHARIRGGKLNDAIRERSL